MIKRISISILLPFVSFLAQSAFAQTASITGTVKDSTGGLVPQAQITTKNEAINASRRALTDESGTYRITSLVPGIYDVFIEKQGFKTVEYSKVELTVDQVQNLDARLAPSSITEKVTVKGESVAPVDLNDAQIGNIITTQQMTSLPMVLRDPYQLALLSPGTTQSNSLLQGLSVNGSRERNNNFLLDGTDNNDADIPGLSQPQPGLTSLNPDAVQEFRVITSNLLPQFGRNTGAVVDIVTRRGANDFHSDLYWFGRYDALGARDFFNHQLTSSGQVAAKDSYARNTFGGSTGGPIKRDKTFWFGAVPSSEWAQSGRCSKPALLSQQNRRDWGQCHSSGRSQLHTEGNSHGPLYVQPVQGPQLCPHRFPSCLGGHRHPATQTGCLYPSDIRARSASCK